MDIMTREQRSYTMSRIRSRDTKPERTVRLFLWHHGIRYRKNVRKLPGTPDIVIHKLKTVIFVQGCFWHGHESHLSMPKSNVDFWQQKIERNRERDRLNKKVLEAKGWRVLTVWECELTKKRRDETLRKLLFSIKGTQPYYDTGEEPMPLAAEEQGAYGNSDQT